MSELMQDVLMTFGIIYVVFILVALGGLAGSVLLSWIRWVWRWFG